MDVLYKPWGLGFGVWGLGSWLERAPDKGEVSGSNPEWPNGGIAQLVEHRPCKAVVSGSNPLTST